MFQADTRVLIVDDMPAMRKLILKICQDIGLTDLTEVGDGSLAWEAIQSASTPFGLIISDWDMPHCTGIDLVKRLRADQRFSKTPFLLINAETDRDQVLQALQSGIDHYLVKPFTAEALTEKLEIIQKKRS